MLDDFLESEHGYEKGTILETLKNMDVTGSDDDIITTLPQGAHYIVYSLGEVDGDKYYILKRYDLSGRKLHQDGQMVPLGKSDVEDKSIFYHFERPGLSRRETEWYEVFSMRKQMPPNFLIPEIHTAKH